MIHNISEIEVKCLPNDLVHEIEVDVSGLNNFDDSILVKDLKLPKGLELLHHEPEEAVIIVTIPKAEVVEEPVAPEAAEAEASVETPAEGKTEEKKAE